MRKECVLLFFVCGGRKLSLRHCNEYLEIISESVVFKKGKTARGLNHKLKAGMLGDKLQLLLFLNIWKAHTKKKKPQSCWIILQSSQALEQNNWIPAVNEAFQSMSEFSLFALFMHGFLLHELDELFWHRSVVSGYSSFLLVSKNTIHISLRGIGRR